VTSSLAGRTEAPVLPPGEIRTGGFGPDGLVDHLRREGFELLIDATHPFAATISATAVAASGKTGCPLIVLRRPGWTEVDGDDWIRVPDIATAADDIAERPPGLVFVTTGRQEIGAFAGDETHDFLIRMATEPGEADLPARSTLIVARGPFSIQGEQSLMREFAVTILVTKDSGGTHVHPKLVAARLERIPVVMIDRPAVPDGGTVVDSVEAVLQLTPGR
jgi:precorrin-6A/cobalt-precorrin-6A reductase